MRINNYSYSLQKADKVYLRQFGFVEQEKVIPNEIKVAKADEPLPSQCAADLQKLEYMVRISPEPQDDKIIEKERKTNYLVVDLIEILDNELEHYQILVSMIINQRKCFADGDIAHFEEISKQQGTIILKIKTLEEARKSAISQLSQWFGIFQDGLTLSKLADLVEPLHRIQLLSLQGDIQLIIKNLDSLKESNAYPAKNALHYVSGVLRIFTSSRSSNVKYSNNGQLEHDQKTGKLMQILYI